MPLVMVVLILNPRLLWELIAVVIKLVLVSALQEAKEIAEETLDFALYSSTSEPGTASLSDWLPSIGLSALFFTMIRMLKPM